MKKFFILIHITVMMMMSSCYNFKEVSVLGIKSFKIKKITTKEMDTELSVSIKNPNEFGFYIYSGKANVYFSNLSLGKATLEKQIYIPARSTGTYTLLLHTTFDKISMQDIINSIGLSHIGKVKIDGHIKVGKFFFIRKKIKVDYEGHPMSSIDFNFSH